MLREMGTNSQDSIGWPCRCSGCPRITFVDQEPRMCAPCMVGNHGHPKDHRCTATDIVDKLATFIINNYADLIEEGRDPADIAIILINRGRLLTEEPQAYGEDPVVRVDGPVADNRPQDGDQAGLEGNIRGALGTWGPCDRVRSQPEVQGETNRDGRAY